jgi:hypothetical protein
MQATMENEEPICSKSTKLTLRLPLLLLFESGSVLQALNLESHVKDWTTYEILVAQQPELRNPSY